MQEFVEIASPVEHECAVPDTTRWHVLEPITGQWSWLSLFSCCGKAYDDRPASLDTADSSETADIRKAA